jgi:hypothetical protein
MAVEVDTPTTSPNETLTGSPASSPDTQLYCALTGRPVTPEEAYWAPPLVTFKELASMTLSTLIRSPSMIGHILMAEQPDVPYSPEARDLLAKRRQAEQIKLLLALLVIAAIITAPILLLSM